MGRWAPGARGRLTQAAYELFAERGYERTTVAEIAERAGLTERTFFRYFTDKREVLFDGAATLRDLMLKAVAEAPPEASPMDAVAAGLVAIGEAFPAENLASSRERQALIDAHADLRERELIKMAGYSADLAAALRDRGVPEPAASLAAETGIAIFKVAFTRWMSEGDRRGLTPLMRESLAELRAMTA